MKGSDLICQKTIRKICGKIYDKYIMLISLEDIATEYLSPRFFQ